MEEIKKKIMLKKEGDNQKQKLKHQTIVRFVSTLQTKIHKCTCRHQNKIGGDYVKIL